MPAPDGRSRPCPRCGALNSASFERCVRCAAPLQPLAAGADLLSRGVDANALWGTKVLFGLTMLVFIAQVAVSQRSPGGTGIGQRIMGLVLQGFDRPQILQFGGMTATIEAARAEPLRLLSAVFVHFSALHIAFNMLALGDLGRVAEPGIGTARFVVAYLVSGVAGFAIGAGWNELLGAASFTAGASGAVFGVSGLILGWLYMTRDQRWGGRDRRWLRYALTTAAYAVLINLFPFKVNNAAHIGGLLCGVGFGLYYAWRPRPKSLLLPNLGALAGLALVVVSLVMAQRAASWGRRPSPRPGRASAVQAGPDLRRARARLILPTRAPSKPHPPQENP